MSTENTVTTSNVTPLRSYILRIAIGVFLVALLLAYGMSFQVSEGTQTVVTRFDRPIRTVKDAGLYWKLPWPIEKAHSIDMRKRIFNTPHASMLTKEQYSIQLLTYVVWKVDDPLLYLESLSREDTFREQSKSMDLNHALIESAQKALEGVVVDSENRFVGNYSLSSLVSTNENEICAEEIEENILREIKGSIRKDYGIDVLQVGIKRMSVPETNMKTILDSMRAERVKLASELKAKGDKDADKIKKDADLKAEELQTAGRMEAGKIIGEAEQEATRIDAKANSFAPEFYSFWRSMQTLRNTLNGNATIVLRNDNEFFKMLFEEPNKGEAPANITAPVQPVPAPVQPAPAP
ncbi:MAG: protease modulator HflC [Thermoguttaceae bacterium]|nr:protease modulator HflC [Thermoguttaceae bacterium]